MTSFTSGADVAKLNQEQDRDETNGRRSHHSTAELAGDFSRELTTLVHDEISLAKAELADKGRIAGLGAGLLGCAAALALLGAGALVAAAIAALHLVWPVWLSALVVGAAVLVVGLMVALSGKRVVAKAGPPVPEQAIESVKEDVSWLKTQARSARG
jgi:Putative Actinobacterial Holin-X, holin superfamily III